VEIFEFEHISALLSTTIFPQCRQQRRSFFRAVVNNAEIIGVVGNNAEKAHELKLEHFPALLPTTGKND
jgi:hypothetical protein